MIEPMPDIPSRFTRILGARWVDKSIAVVAVLPFALVIGSLVYLGDFDVPQLVLLIQLAVLALTMVVRRPPVRVTTNPVFWALAFMVTYWPLLIGALDFEDEGAPLTPTWLSNGVALLSLAVSVWARVSLGRNIGFVPAERAIVTTGAYAYVRHPIYSGIFLGVLAAGLSRFSWRNLALDTLWCALLIIKTFIEERFLRQNPEYARYMEHVRWRWVPSLA
jgi:protein-S-isoprenylcysteine O-methyltransferase Ste14